MTGADTGAACSAATFAGTITSVHASPHGGGVVTVRDRAGLTRRAVVPGNILSRPPEAGERWRFTGEVRVHPEHGEALRCRVALPLLPEGDGIVRLLAESRRFTGIGWRTAERLWNGLGEGLYDALRGRDHERLASVAGIERAGVLIAGFGVLSEEVEVLQRLDRHGVDGRTTVTAVSIWGSAAVARIEADPYALALLEPWATVDRRALRMGVHPSDERRLSAAVEEACAARWRGHHTATDRAVLVQTVDETLGGHADVQAALAVERAISAKRLLAAPAGDLWQSRAAHLMEREVERQFRERLSREAGPLPPTAVADAIRRTEAAGGHSLSPQQREAVHMALSSPLGVVCGPAGTGKTTIAKAIVDAARSRPEGGAQMVALSGRAAKRLAEAAGGRDPEAAGGGKGETGRPTAVALTIARFLRGLEVGKLRMDPGELLVIDEASMVDLPTVYRLLRAVPPTTDLLFIGDPAQLPPVGPGLIYHQLVGCAGVPQVSLAQVHRQADDTGIPAVAGEIRLGGVPRLRSFDAEDPLAPGVFSARCATDDVERTALAVFEAMVGAPTEDPGLEHLHSLDVQILAATKHGAAGADTLNACVEARWTSRQEPMHGWGLRLGSKVLWLKNDYDKAPLLDADGQPVVDEAGEPVRQGFMNGAIGVVRRLGRKSVFVEFDDGTSDHVLPRDLEKMRRGWAVSVHKAQGSSFQHVVVPVTRSRLLDRSWIYTAVTRAKRSCVFVGDEAHLREIVHTEPFASQRDVGFLPDFIDLRA